MVVWSGNVDWSLIEALLRCNLGCVSTCLDDIVVLGHWVVAHGCRIGRGALIGIGAIVLNGAEIGKESIVGAGSVVTSGTVIPPRTLVLGTPARPLRPLGEKYLAMIRQTIRNYQEMRAIYGGNR